MQAIIVLLNLVIADVEIEGPIPQTADLNGREAEYTSENDIIAYEGVWKTENKSPDSLIELT